MKLDKLRKKIDIIDKKIISLIGQRLNVAKEIKEIKKKEKIPVTNRNREIEVMKNVNSVSASFNINEQLTEKIFRLIIKESKRIQKL
jgi:chorismate mutase